MKILMLIIAVLFVECVEAKRLHKEVYYQDIWCTELGGDQKFVLPDRGRPDCLLKTHAVEFDFCTKWAECIGQSLYYGTATNRAPMCVLICDPAKQDRYIKRFNQAVKYMNRYEKPVLVIIKEVVK